HHLERVENWTGDPVELLLRRWPPEVFQPPLRSSARSKTITMYAVENIEHTSDLDDAPDGGSGRACLALAGTLSDPIRRFLSIVAAIRIARQRRSPRGPPNGCRQLGASHGRKKGMRGANPVGIFGRGAAGPQCKGSGDMPQHGGLRQ